VSCGSKRGEHKLTASTSGPVKITQFYAAKPQVHKGEGTLLCYGVEDAKSVAVEPHFSDLSPALTRCVEVKPEKTTNYTLTATAADGQKVSNNVTIVVGGLPPDIYDFSVNTMTVKRGQQVSVCFKARNAASVSGGPGKFFLKGKPSGDCLMDAPKKTTRYEITVTGNSGETASRDVTVTVQ
jgi:hypothetical protein